MKVKFYKLSNDSNKEIYRVEFSIDNSYYADKGNSGILFNKLKNIESLKSAVRKNEANNIVVDGVDASNYTTLRNAIGHPDSHYAMVSDMPTFYEDVKEYAAKQLAETSGDRDEYGYSKQRP